MKNIPSKKGCKQHKPEAYSFIYNQTDGDSFRNHENGSISLSVADKMYTVDTGKRKADKIEVFFKLHAAQKIEITVCNGNIFLNALD